MNLATIATRMNGRWTTQETVSSMKSDAFGSVLGMLNDFNDNPAELIQKLTSGDGGGMENMAESLAQNPQIAQMVHQVAENLDVSQLASVLPLLGGLGGPPQ